jgi:hypothetical protein
MMQHNSEIDVRAAGPNMDHVLSHLEFLAKPNVGRYPEYNLEIRAISEGAPPRSQLINPTNDDGLEMALHFVEQTNRQGFNNYVTVNPSRPSGQHVKDQDIIQIPFLFADADERGVVSQVKSDFIYRPDAYVCTGTKPFERGHFYWRLEEPIQPADFEQWKELMQNIAKRHGCDPQICNPSRIMRLGGTLSYPSKVKRARGYQTELTAFYEYGGMYG